MLNTNYTICRKVDAPSFWL